MTLTTAQQQFMADMDNQAVHILRHQDEAALLLFLSDKMEKIKTIMDASTHDELNNYCQRYDGFYRCMKLLEKMALGISQGKLNDFLK